MVTPQLPSGIDPIRIKEPLTRLLYEASPHPACYTPHGQDASPLYTSRRCPTDSPRSRLTPVVSKRALARLR